MPRGITAAELVLSPDTPDKEVVGADGLAFKARPVLPPVRSLIRPLVGLMREWLALEMP